MQHATAESIKSMERYRISWTDEAQPLSHRSLAPDQTQPDGWLLHCTVCQHEMRLTVVCGVSHRKQSIHCDSAALSLNKALHDLH